MLGAVSFAAVIVGTAGLIWGEFFDIGRTATLLFAAVNLVGLIGIAPVLFGSKRSGRTPR